MARDGCGCGGIDDGSGLNLKKMMVGLQWP